MQILIERLRALREDNDLIQQQIAQILGTSQTMYARYERGANEFPLRHLVVLCDFYNVPSDYFLGLKSDRSRRFGAAKIQTINNVPAAGSS